MIEPVYKKPSGWKGSKGDTYWTKDTALGVKYMCQTCGRSVLGLGADSYNHRADCERNQNRVIGFGVKADSKICGLIKNHDTVVRVYSAENEPMVVGEVPIAVWDQIAAPLRTYFNERLRFHGLPAQDWTAHTLIDRLLTKEVAVLMWMIGEDVGKALRQWLELTPEDRWWLYGKGKLCDKWRKAIAVVGS